MSDISTLCEVRDVIARLKLARITCRDAGIYNNAIDDALFEIEEMISAEDASLATYAPAELIH